MHDYANENIVIRVSIPHKYCKLYSDAVILSYISPPVHTNVIWICYNPDLIQQHIINMV